MTTEKRILLWCQASNNEARIRLAEALLASSASGVPFDVHFSGEGVRILATLSATTQPEESLAQSAIAYLHTNGYEDSYALIRDAMQYAASVTVCATWLRACGVQAEGYITAGTPVVIAQAVANGSILVPCA